MSGEILDGCGKHYSTNVHGENDRLDITVRAERCRLDLTVEGAIEYTDAEDGIARMGRGARFEVEVDREGDRRRLLVEPGDGGAPRITWWVDGDERPFDAEARAWLADLLPRFFRASGIEAEGRTRRLLARSGVDGVFREIELIPGDHVTRRYLAALMEATELDREQIVRWTTTAAGNLESDYELAEALSSLPAAALGDDDVQRAFVRATASIDSDYEVRRTLATLLSRERLSSDLLDPILGVARSIESDYELAELLLLVVEQYPAGEALPGDFYAAVTTIGSDYELRRTLVRALGRPISQADLVSLLETARSIDSDYELAELLIAIARTHALEGPAREAYERTLETIGSTYEHDRAAGALIRRT
jgi:hypothetical protein